jgi:hypothetical protein
MTANATASVDQLVRLVTDIKYARGGIAAATPRIMGGDPSWGEEIAVCLKEAEKSLRTAEESTTVFVSALTESRALAE